MENKQFDKDDSVLNNEEELSVQEQNQNIEEMEMDGNVDEQVDAVDNVKDIDDEALNLNHIIKDLTRQLELKQNEIKQQKDSVLRAAAEVDNIKKRTVLDVEKAHKFALENLIKELLPTVDSLERALDIQVEDNEQAQTILEGTDLTLQSFIKALNKFGCYQVNPLEQPFNPEFHQAISMQSSDKYPHNHVIGVMQKGYILNDRLIRPAMVVVASNE